MQNSHFCHDIAHFLNLKVDFDPVCQATFNSKQKPKECRTTLDFIVNKNEEVTYLS